MDKNLNKHIGIVIGYVKTNNKYNIFKYLIKWKNGTNGKSINGKGTTKNIEVPIFRVEETGNSMEYNSFEIFRTKNKPKQ